VAENIVVVSDTAAWRADLFQEITTILFDHTLRQKPSFVEESFEIATTPGNLPG